MIPLQAQKHQGMLGATKGGTRKEGFFPKGFRGTVGLPTLWFQTCGLGTLREYISVILKCQVCGNLLQQSQEMNAMFPH